MESEIVGLLATPPSMKMLDLPTKEKRSNQRDQKVADVSKFIDWHSSQIFFLNHVRYRLSKSGYSFLDFPTLANLSATSRWIRIKCNEIWKAFVNSQILPFTLIEPYLPEGRDRTWMYSHTLCKGLMDVLLSTDNQSTEERFLEAAKNGHLNTLNILIEQGVDIQSHDGEGNTALILAAREVHPVVTHILLDHLKQRTNINIPSFLAIGNASHSTAWTIANQKVYDAHCNNEGNLNECLENATQLASVLARADRIKWKIKKTKLHWVRYTTLVCPYFPCCCESPKEDNWRKEFVRIEDWCKC